MIGVAIYAFFFGIAVTILAALALRDTGLRGRYERLECEHARVVAEHDRMVAEHLEQEYRRSRVHPMTDEEIIIAAREFIG